MIRKIMLALAVILLVYTSSVQAEDGYKISFGKTFDEAFGASMPEGSIVYKFDLGKVNRQFFLFGEDPSRWFWDRELYITGLLNNKAGDDNFLTGGVGWRLRFGGTIGKVDISLGVGLLSIYKSGKIDNLADCPVLGTLELIGEINFAENHRLALSVGHVSSFLHNSDDGDSGVNLGMVAYKYDFYFEDIFKKFKRKIS